MKKYICQTDRVFRRGKLYRKGDIALFEKGVVGEDDKHFEDLDEVNRRAEERAAAKNSVLKRDQNPDEMAARIAELEAELKKSKEKGEKKPKAKAKAEEEPKVEEDVAEENPHIMDI